MHSFCLSSNIRRISGHQCFSLLVHSLCAVNFEFFIPSPILVKISIFVFYFKNAVNYVAIIGIIVRHRSCCHDLHQTERREPRILYVILNPVVFVNCKLGLWRNTPKAISLGRQQIHSLTTSTTNVNVYFRICPPERLINKILYINNIVIPMM